MPYRMQKLAEYIRGWMGYFQLSEFYKPFPLLDQWIRRRIRCCFIKQWRKAKTKVANLMKLGVDKVKAASIGTSNKGYYRLSRTYAVQLGLSDKYLAEIGLVSMKDLWVKFHHHQ